MTATSKSATTDSGFIQRVERKVREQLRAKQVGYLLGAGASFLGGRGYPLSTSIWDQIKGELPDGERSDIQEKLDSGADGLEHALDLLDRGEPVETQHRRLVTDAIANCFRGITAPLADHQRLLQRLSARNDEFIHVFNLNYDPLVELAADQCKIHIVDGFGGSERPFFDSHLFELSQGVVQRQHRNHVFRAQRGAIHHYKLHGSIGWYECPTDGIRRCGCTVPLPVGTKLLMVPPQHRKVTDTLSLPYSTLWSEFRKLLRQGSPLLNRLVVIGYGMRDSHVNAVIDSALARSDFTLLVFVKSLIDEVFDRWSACPNAILVTMDRCSLYSEKGEGHSELWDFSKLTKEV